MNENKATSSALNALNKLKAIDITVLDVTSLTSITDTMIICTATSTRHAKSLCDEVSKTAKEEGIMPLGVEGVDTAEWIVVDLGDAVIHIMLTTARSFYNLEKLWTPITVDSEANPSLH